MKRQSSPKKSERPIMTNKEAAVQQSPALQQTQGSKRKPVVNKLTEIKEEVKDFESPPAQKIAKKNMVDAETQTDKPATQPSKISDRFTRARGSDAKPEMIQTYQNTNQPVIIAARQVNVFQNSILPAT